MSNSKGVITFVKRRKKDLISVFGSKCCICGFNQFQEALEFHHVNPNEKEFGITSATTTRAIEIQLAELRKCICVCANCHRGIHAGYLLVPNNWQMLYDEQRAQELIAQVHQKKYYCPNCGQEKSRSGLVCTTCAAKAQRVTDRPSRDVLKQLIRTIPFTQIGIQYNVSDNAIKKWCDAEHLPRTKKEIKSYNDAEWEQI